MELLKQLGVVTLYSVPVFRTEHQFFGCAYRSVQVLREVIGGHLIGGSMMSSKLLGELSDGTAQYVWLATVASPTTTPLMAPALKIAAPKDQLSRAALFIPCWSRAAIAGRTS